MADEKPERTTWWDWCTRVIAIIAFVMSLFNFVHERQNTKLANARAASELNDKAWDALGGEAGSQDIAHGSAANNAAARQQALNFVNQGLLLAPKDPDLLGTKGVILAEQGDIAAAKRYYKESLAIGPRDATAHTGLGALLQDEGKTDEAIALYKQAIAAAPEQLWNVYFNLGGAYVEKGEYGSAAGAFRKAIEQKRDFTEAYTELALVLEKQGKHAEARVEQAKADKLKGVQTADVSPPK